MDIGPTGLAQIGAVLTMTAGVGFAYVASLSTRQVQFEWLGGSMIVVALAMTGLMLGPVIGNPLN